MNFIIPQNYKFKNKILGIIDYPTAILNVAWNIIIYFFLKNIVTSIFKSIIPHPAYNRNRF